MEHFNDKSDLRKTGCYPHRGGWPTLTEWDAKKSSTKLTYHFSVTWLARVVFSSNTNTVKIRRDGALSIWLP